MSGTRVLREWLNFTSRAAVRLLGEERSAFREVLHLGIVVDVEVLGLEDVPFEIGVLHLVPPEVEELGGEGGGEDQKDEENDQHGQKRASWPARQFPYAPRR